MSDKVRLASLANGSEFGTLSGKTGIVIQKSQERNYEGVWVLIDGEQFSRVLHRDCIVTSLNGKVRHIARLRDQHVR